MNKIEKAFAVGFVLSVAMIGYGVLTEALAQEAPGQARYEVHYVSTNGDAEQTSLEMIEEQLVKLSNTKARILQAAGQRLGLTPDMTIAWDSEKKLLAIRVPVRPSPAPAPPTAAVSPVDSGTPGTK